MPLCHNKVFENAYCLWKRQQGVLAVRIAGSGASIGAPCDSITLHENHANLVEVKSCKGTVFYVREKVRKQLEALRQACIEHGGKPILAIRFKNRKWLELDISEGLPNKVEVR
jgi:Holliday junction resolvase